MAFSVVVTGASGFIGNALVKKLKYEPDIDVVSVSRSVIGESDICIDDYRDTPLGDVLVHLAENPNRLCVNQAGESCIKEAEIVLDAMIAKGYSRIIYCSSAVVYGDAGNVPYTEESPVYPFDNYARMKLNNEQRVINAGGTIVRLVNIIGPGMAKNNVLSNIFSQLLDAGPLRVRNEIPVRDFIWLDDVVSAFLILIREGSMGIYNIGTGVGISIREMAEKVLKVAGKDMRGVKSLAVSPLPSYNVVDIGKMRSTYGWSPKLTLDQSIENLVSEI